ncbi:DUF4876 domain-containing protein [Pedobacter agri]|uniref:DUF4876 domain-containing protein n=1 Tax=Pedobacter agri TaxID=454586 RepID=UPI00278867EA|nr:DUF4876 domain-containing protein [Pedobacter agri]MDQ1139849.1 hypothetical protein [Pedobacter agri]
MKKYLYLLLAVSILASCKKNNSTDIQPVDVNVKLAYNLQASNYQLPLTAIKVKVTNIDTKIAQNFTVNDKGTLIVPQLAPGFYDIDASATISAADYSALTGTLVTKDVTYNASVKKKQITVNFSETVALNLVTGTTGDWVIKQVYFAGSDRVNGALYRDQFIEFYNNSDKVLYADSLYFAETVGLVTKTSAATYNVTASSQYDWSKSVNMPANIDANNDYIYARAFLMIPGTGKQYPVQPGTSIVVAQTAINHKSPYTGVDGKAISVLNADLTIDLSKADFEAYYAPLLSKPLASDIDNPSVPNLEVLQYFGTDMIFDNPGRYSYALIKVDGTQKPKDWPQYNLPTKATPSSTSTKYYQIPNKWVIDAVEVQPNEVADRIPKKYDASLDAGFTFVPLGSYTSQSIIRKTEKSVNGRVILKDTNNSTEDFDYFNLANPRGFK